MLTHAPFNTYSVSHIYPFFLILCRVGSAIMVLPGFSEFYVPIRVRLLFACFLSIIFIPIAKEYLPPLPASSVALGGCIFIECCIGIYFGMLVRIMTSISHTAGSLISSQSGLGNANLFDPSQGGQSSLFSGFMGLIALLLLFASNLHQMIFKGIKSSYASFPPGSMPRTGDMAEVITHVFSKSFFIAFQMSSPFILIGILFFLGMGVIARIMPNIQVFFIIVPAQILMNFFIFSLIISTLFLWYMEHTEQLFSEIFHYL